MPTLGKHWEAHAGTDTFKFKPVIMMVGNMPSKATIALPAKLVRRWIQDGCTHRKPHHRKIALFDQGRIPFGIPLFGATNILPNTFMDSCGGKMS